MYSLNALTVYNRNSICLRCQCQCPLEYALSVIVYYITDNKPLKTVQTNLSSLNHAVFDTLPRNNQVFLFLGSNY